MSKFDDWIRSVPSPDDIRPMVAGAEKALYDAQNNLTFIRGCLAMSLGLRVQPGNPPSAQPPVEAPAPQPEPTEPKKRGKKKPPCFGDPELLGDGCPEDPPCPVGEECKAECDKKRNSV